MYCFLLLTKYSESDKLFYQYYQLFIGDQGNRVSGKTRVDGATLGNFTDSGLQQGNITRYREWGPCCSAGDCHVIFQ